MDKRISAVKGHYIVCGIGGIGRHIIDEMYKTGRPFVAIDKKEEVCRELSEKDMLFVRGDATSSAVLKAANVERAKGIFCSLHNDAENLLLILTVKGINPKLRIITKAEEYESEDKMKNAGADGVVLPEFIGGLRMASEMVRPEAVTFLDKMLKSRDKVFRVEDISIIFDSMFIGKTLRESGLLNKEGITVVALRRENEYIFNPSENEKLKAGDVIILIGETKGIEEIKKLAE
jgi:voltage-gated potassium channel